MNKFNLQTLKKSAKGITLIALVITIIILLILAGISVNMLTGNNGIINKASEAKIEAEKSDEKEQILMAVTSAQISDTGFGELTQSSLQNAINSQFGNGKATVTDNADGTFTVTMNNDSGRTYKFKSDGTQLDNTEVAKLEPGLYDENDVMTVTWEELVGTYGLNISVDYGEGQFYDWDPINNTDVLNNGPTGSARNVFITNNLSGKLILPDNITKIGDWAFYNCTSLTSLTIPNSVTSIGYLAFDSVNHIYYSGTATGSPWGASAIN